MALDVLPPCSEQSLLAGESLNATAIADVNVWLLLEVPGKWEPDIAHHPLDPTTRAWLDAQQARVPRCRTLFVRADRPSETTTLHVATTGAHARIHRFEAPSSAGFAGIDVKHLIDAGSTEAERLGGVAVPSLVLVCTHGRRDVCCARKGVAVFRALDALAPQGTVWQSSHLGGHRFAATLVALPEGLHYGRIEPEDAAPMLDAHAHGRLYRLDRYRGRTHLSMHQQVAEMALRSEHHELRLDSIEPAPGASSGVVRLRTHDGAVHDFEVEVRKDGPLRQASCGSEPPTPGSTAVARRLR